MRFSVSSLLALGLASLPSALAGAGQMGFCLGNVLADGVTCKSQSDYEADLDAIAESGSKLVRIYAASNCYCAANLLPAAQAKGFQVILGVWPDTPESLEADMAAVQQYVPQYQSTVYGVTVGSETLYRGNFTGPELLEKINQVRAVLPPGTKMGTADSWNMFAYGTGDAVIQGGVEMILANGFAYWQASPIANASHVYFDDMMQTLGHIQSLTGSLDSIEFINGEAGWPTDGGSNYGAADAGTANAQEFFDQGFCGMLAWGITSFWFEAFDEPWKPNSVGMDGAAEIETTWGMWTVDRVLKFNNTC